MLNIKKWLVVLLDLSLMFSIVPIDCFAEGTHEIMHVDFDLDKMTNVLSEETEGIDVIETNPEEEMQAQTDDPVEVQLEVQNEAETMLLGDPAVTVSSYTDAFANAFAAQLISYGIASESDFGNYIIESETDYTLKVGTDSRILVLLSRMSQSVTSNYCNWIIDFDITGLSLDVTLDVPNSTDKLTYIGLGDSDYPFAGKFTGNIGSISSKNTIFKAVSTGLTIEQSGSDFVGISWSGSKDKPILANKVVADSTEPSLKMPLISSSTFSPYIGELTGNRGQWTIGSLNYSGANNTYQDGETINGNLGLVCNHMETNASLKIGQIILDKQADLRGSDNVGGLVGKMDSGAVLTIGDDLNLNVKTQGNITGSIVGYSDGGSVVIEADKNVTIDATVSGESAGGIAGKMESVSGLITGDGNLTLNSINVTGSKKAGGLFGECSITGEFDPLSKVTMVKPNISGNGTNTYCGGLFGTLNLTAEGKCKIGSDSSNSVNVDSILAMSNNTVQYGGIAGYLSGAARKNALVVSYATVTAEVKSGLVASNFPMEIGGLVAVQGSDITIDANNSTVALTNPRTPLNTYGIGGLCTDVGDRALLIADTMKVVIDSFVDNQGSSGIAATTGKGAVVYLRNKLDLSEALLATCAYSGQIVGKQECSLIYAPNVTIDRLKTSLGTTSYSGVQLDDIGNYGELYRIQELVNVSDDGNYTLNYLHTISQNDGIYVLSSAFDYACLALAWQSRGYFPTVQGITTDNWSIPSSITLRDDINLTGCGMGGLTRDVYATDDTFTGTFNGGDYTLTLDIGAENTSNTVNYGDGRIYWHNATGLFAGLSNNATVHNLILGGSVRLSNSKKSPMYSGAVSAMIKGDRSEGSTFSAISSDVNYDAIVSGGNQLYLGGIIGYIAGGNSLIDFSGSNVTANIDITHSGNGNSNHFGGVIGAIGEDASATLTFGSESSATILEGRIASTGSVYNLHCGSIVGTIFPSTAKTRIININNLEIKVYSISGSPSERMSGLLGGVWANTEVTINGLETSDNSTLTSNGVAEVGGLVYRASGKWTVNNLNISKLTINANKAKALGLIVCHGETYNEYFNGSTRNTGALYLEMASDWENGYIVPGTITYAGDVFDEFVAYTANRSNDSYDITRCGSAVVSIKTNNNTVNMVSGARNTYCNRTTIGQNKQANKYSRYYYNLKYIMDEQPDTNDGLINTASELLIWSVYRYSDSSIQKHFTIQGINDLSSRLTVGGTLDNLANFNMDGYSYYPIDIVNQNVVVNYANVIFHNAEIEKKEIDNKTTIGNDADHSQHYMMHCALFHDFRAENISSNSEYTLTVNGINFAGTIGLVNGGAGALLCGNVKGEFNGVNTAICKVVLADEDNPTRAIALNGISVSVEPKPNYCPVLINKISSYSSLEANYINTTVSQTGFAGSSLIGDVGNSTAQSITVSFEGTIELPEQTRVFTKATLLNSLGFVDGSATYNFRAEKDNNKHESTHGRELTTSVEYEGKIGNYEVEGEQEIVIDPKDGSTDFSGYLPYVAFSPASGDDTYTLENNWHEIAVNIRSFNVLNGCGTYGHPYIVTANQFKEIANFINTGRASNGWQVRMPKEVSDYHSTEGENDEIISYSTSERTTAEKIRSHLRGAYYKLTYENYKFELKNFNGIGTKPETAFKGVIDGNGITVTLTGGSSAFIKYSYGSVVRNVTILYQHGQNQQLSISWSSPGRDTSNGTTMPQQSPATFFGGVIGSVLGGDNIIEDVNVNCNKFNISLTDGKTYLIPVGGYIGVIAGGGVIFRGAYTNDTGITGTDAQLYKNPIIGRVLDGYAFYEGSGTAPDSGDTKDGQNYKINKITPADVGKDKDLVLSSNNSTQTLTVNNAQGLLILSAIVSSGAGSTESNAYTKGVVRNAAYNQIGASSKPNDYDIAKSDPEKTISYLSNYVAVSGANNTIRNICTSGTDGITINVAKDINNNPITLDMSNYGNGYRGLSARYVSNAAFNDSSVTPYMVVMRVKSFDGQNATVNGIDMNVKEYADDDFHMASIGGIFNIVWTKKNGGGTNTSDGAFAKNITISDFNISLRYVDINGVEQKQADTSTFVDKDGLCAVTVGGFIGSISDDGATTKTKDKYGNYLFDNIVISGTSNESRGTIHGPNSAGGIIGASAMTSTYLEGYPGVLLSNKQSVRFGPNFLNCSYSNVDITGKIVAGGLVGAAYAYESTDVQFGSMGTSYSSGNYCFASVTVTDNNVIVGNNATITASSQHGVSAGLFGVVGMRSAVNYSNVNNETGLQIATKDLMIRVFLTDVKVLSSTTEDVIYRSDGTTANGPDKSATNTASGGLIGRISHVNQSYIYDVNMDSVIANANTQVSGSYAGGIIAYGYTNTSIIVQDCIITDSSYINGKYAGGLLGYGWAGSGGFNLHVSDCEISDSTINGMSYSGGLVGRAGGKYYLINILLKNTSITGHNTQRGRLFGEMNDPTNTFYVKAAGISVYFDNNQNDVVVPTNDGNTTTYNGYIAYCDYSANNTIVTGKQNPYVTVNPNYQLTGCDKVLYGDAVHIQSTENDNVITTGSRIWKDQKDGVSNSSKLNLVPYNSISSSIIAKDLPEISTFKAVQGVGPDNLPVLTIKGGDATVIEDYLNVITNGGYSKAKTITKNATKDEDKVLELNVDVYSYEKNEEDGYFILKTKDDLDNDKTPASIYLDGTDIKVLGSSYDNTRNRFSLVEATFKTTVNGQPRTYTVSIPVVVIRELQYDFMATLTYGAEFQKTTYGTLDKHVLESAGNPITAYLTYSYNREKGDYVPYDWQSYMESGGNVLSIDKKLKFTNGLPKDTQLILVDCQNGNRAYQYKVGKGGITDVHLSEFTSASSEDPFSSSMADVLGVTMTESDSGKFVELTDEGQATVKLGNKYYRLYKDGDEGKRYDLQVPNLEKNNPRENYYLLINVPEQSGSEYFLNGNIKSELVWNMPNSGTQVHRYNESIIDPVSDSESTYQIYSGYQQSLVPLTETGEAINLLDANKKMQVAFKDTITFSSKQAYGDEDPLFAKFNVSLRKFTNASSSPEDLQFAVGTSGTVYFYIQDSSGQYYTFNGTSWSTDASEKEAASYEWVSQGNNMELLLSKNGKEALDLAGVRQMIKKNNSLQSEIIITAKMDVKFNDQDVINATVPASEKNGTDVWAQLHYAAMLSAQANSLSYSSNRLAIDDNAHYYRSVKYAAVLSLDAALIDQLGVNPLEPVEEYMTFFDGKESAHIELNAALDLKNLPDYENTLKNSKEIRFALSLEKRNGGDDYIGIEDASNLIGFKWKDGSQGWNWSISQSQFVENGELKESELYTDGRFSFPLDAYVSVEPRDFANYKIKLAVSFIGENGTLLSVEVEDSDAYVVYTYASIKPTFYSFSTSN